jgi:two-component system, LytTR family, sensor kinase
VNLVGFITGAVLYAMLLALVLRAPVRHGVGASADRLPLATAVLGLIWNLGELAAYLLPRLGVAAASVGLTAISFPALGLLAAVVVHSVARTLPRGNAIARGAYACAIAAGLLHVQTVVTGDPRPSLVAFALLTICFSVVIVVLAVLTRRQANGPRALWMLALALVAISATHLGRNHGDTSHWLIELAGHHAAIPLAFAILYQDYRFALADLFLKQALTLLVLVAVAFGGYVVISALAGTSSLAVGALLVLWIGSTLVYPWMRRQIVRFVDAVLLGRTDYVVLRHTITQELATLDTIEGVLNLACRRLGEALDARRVEWHTVGSSGRRRGAALHIVLPTAEQPMFAIDIQDLAGGRRLLSDDAELAESVAALAARRIDQVRLMKERDERLVHDEEMQKLTAEAELRALRAQINPHFLFNALTTIGYLIDSSPSKALDTLMRLTSLLRGVLRSDGEWTTLGREMELVEHYLDIERARFEERLRVVIDVPHDLRNIPVPALLVQPLVENAVKHGVAPAVDGGDVRVTARLGGEGGSRTLRLVVWNTGAPLASTARPDGVGLTNVERRLRGHYHGAARLRVARGNDGATVASIDVPATEVRTHDTALEPVARGAGG